MTVSYYIFIYNLTILYPMLCVPFSSLERVKSSARSDVLWTPVELAGEGFPISSLI